MFEELRKELAEALKSGSKRLLATHLQTLLAYPDGCTKGGTVFDPRSGDVIVQVRPCPRRSSTRRRRRSSTWWRRRGWRGRRVLVYVTHTGTRDITGRMDDILTRHGFRVAVMKADAVAPNRREAWVADKVQQGIDVLICHPRLVQTGLDLIDFPTTVWDETDYSVCVVRQASRRSWRIGQTRPVKVVFMSYKNTLQADALKLVAKKLQSSLAVEGELPEDGLAAYGDDGDDMMMALARKIVSGEEEDEAETMEEVFAQARDAEATAEELLVDDGWKVVESLPRAGHGVEPETVAVNSNMADDGRDDPQLVPMIEQAEETTGTKSEMTLADAAYHSGKGLEGCARRGQSVAMPDTRQQLLGDPYHKDRFTYDEHSDSFRCPQGQRLQFLRIQRLNGVAWRLYRASEGICQACPASGVCTKSKEFGRSVTIGPYDAALRRHRVWMSTNEAREVYRRRKPLVEPVFGIIKEQLAARRFLLRGFANVSAEWTLLGTAFNLRTLWRVSCLGVFADLLRGPKPHFAT